MSDQKEEQMMEAEALEAIFESSFEIVEGSTQPFVWRITLWPEATTDEVNHVGVAVTVTLPEAYPDAALPECEVSILKGLTSEHANTLLDLAREEAQNNEGVPSVFAICERIREWLVENNQKGLDDTSAFAQMMRRDAEAKKKEMDKQKLSTQFEAQKAHDEMTEAEREELELRRRRAEGTPCNAENFAAWKKKFDEEMRLRKDKEQTDLQDAKTRKGKAKTAAEKQLDQDKATRLTGYQQFSDKAFNLEAFELAGENAQADPDEEEADQQAAALFNDNDNIQEELFDVDDEDLDDLDFDDDDDDEEEEDVDI